MEGEGASALLAGCTHLGELLGGRSIRGHRRLSRTSLQVSPARRELLGKHD